MSERASYPLLESCADRLRTAGNRRLAEITLVAAVGEELSAKDLQISAETLQAQAEVARQAGYAQLAANLTRAAELTAVSNETLLAMYEQLRPGRSTYEELLELARLLQDEYNAVETASFVREAASVYQRLKAKG